MTTYTELNAVLQQRMHLPDRPFNFDLDADRAAMGQLLYLAVLQNRRETGLIISALVKFLNENDAGAGFYGLAQKLGMLHSDATKDEKYAFWVDQVRQLHEHYRRPRRRV